MTNPDPLKIEQARAAIDAAMQEMQAFLPHLAAARRAYFNSRTQESLDALERIEQQALALDGQSKAKLKEFELAAGVTEADLQALQTQERTGDAEARVERGELTAEEIAPSGNIREVLTRGIEGLLAKVGEKQLKPIRATEPSRLLPDLRKQPLSLVRGVRPESEISTKHRFAQSLLLAMDYLDGQPDYDPFAGAMLVPQLATLTDKLQVLSEIPGANKRLRSLWKGPSSEFDSTIFELLVAARCSEMGRSVRFVEPQSSPTQDLMCDDPYPLAIECKRKRALSQYELQEERFMRGLYEQIDAGARSEGMSGTFHLELFVEFSVAPVPEIVHRAMLQKYAGGTGKPTAYAWGSVAFLECPARIDLPAITRLYSPEMLAYVFDWDTDLSSHDGIICRISNVHEAIIGDVQRPVALLWSNTSETAVRRRAFTPLSLYTEALEQIPAGDFGIIYVAYQDGAREEVANARMSAFMASLKETEHRSSIRVPLVNLVRLYPRALGQGGPDLIESTMNFVANYGDDVLPSQFPSRVFTAI